MVLSGSTVPKSNAAAPSCCECARAGRRALPARRARESPKPGRVSSRASVAGPSPSDVSARMRAPGCRCGTIRSGARPCSDSSAQSGQRPAEPRRGQAESRRRGQHDHLAGRDHARQQRADAVEERIARREHADRRAAMRQDFVGGALEGRRPRPRRAAYQRRREAEMTPAAEHDFRRADSPRAAALKPSMPSSPMPMMDSQRGDAAVSRPTGSGAA